MKLPIHVLSLCQVEGGGGGADRIVLRTATRANPATVKMTVCCLREAADATFDMDQRAAHLGIDYHEVVERSKFDRRTLTYLRRLVRERQIRIVHAHNYKAVVYGSCLAHLEEVIPLSTSHGWTGAHWRERFAYYPLDRLLIRRFPAAIAVSGEIRDTLVRWRCRPERVRVIVNGIDPSEFVPSAEIRGRVRQRLRVNPGEIVIGAAGRLERQKRFDVLIETMKLLLRRSRPVRLFIAGEGSLRPALEKQIQSLGLGSACQLLGHCADIKDVYQGFDLLVQSSDYEGTPTVVAEAMALKVPVVATDVGGTTELAEDDRHALIVARRDPAALADAVENTLDDPVATARRVAAARQRVEAELSFETRTRKLELVYQQLATANGASDGRESASVGVSRPSKYVS